MRRFNPTRAQWVGGALAVGAAAAVTYAIVTAREANALRPGYPIPEPLPLPPPGGFPQGAGVGVCNLGPSYPGFEWDGVECSPSVSTPPGIYIVDECSDFIFVPGDDGPQPSELGARIADAVSSGQSTDPTLVVSAFLDTFWPQCSWPPDPAAAERIVQLYMALSVMVGRMIINDGGIVLGTSDPTNVDELIGGRFTDIGYDMFRPHLVPEIELPELDIDEEPPFVGPPSPQPPGPIEPEPPQGGVDLPPGGQGFPGDEPDEPEQPDYPGLVIPAYPVPTKPCQKFPYQGPTKSADLPATWFTTEAHEDVLLFDFAAFNNADCKVYNLRFGICLRPVGAMLYGALNPLHPLPDNPIHLRNMDNAGMTWSQFTGSPLWKKQYGTKIGLANGKAVFNPLAAITDPGVDPCPNDAMIWPTPTGDHFIVTADHGAEPRFRETNWKPRPRVTLHASGKKVYARIYYTGMPKFYVGGADPKWGGIDTPNHLDGDLVSSVVGPANKTPFHVDYKVWALGLM